ncbi:hypothetical protein ACFDWB_005341 [Salmonella enterica]
MLIVKMMEISIIFLDSKILICIKRANFVLLMAKRARVGKERSYAGGE